MGKLKKAAIAATGLVGGGLALLAVDAATNPVDVSMKGQLAARLFEMSGAPDVPEATQFAPDIEEIRKMLSEEALGDLPEDVRVVVIADGEIPASFIRADWGAKEAAPFVFTSFQIVYPSDEWVHPDTIVLDPMSGEGDEYFEKKWLYPSSFDFDSNATGQLWAAMEDAESIHASHAHWDHVRGILEGDDIQSLIGKTFFTRSQADHLASTYGGWSAEEVAMIPGDNVVDDVALRRIAPGVIEIDAPGHTPGHKMFFVKTGDGQEYLFIGDTVHSMSNIRDGVPRSKQLSSASGEDAAAVAGQIEWLQKVLGRKVFPGSKNVEIVVPHDKAHTEGQIERGVLKEGFVIDSPTMSTAY